MKTVLELLGNHPQVSDYKINKTRKESYEIFFVKGKLETVRRTDTCDREVTVYVDHGEFKGESQFFVYPSTTREELSEKIGEAVEKALLIQNPSFTLPQDQSGSFQMESNFREFDPADLAAKISQAVFGANTVENGSLNSVEIFINRYTESVVNSRNLEKTQVRYEAMVEAIPTYNGPEQSVELYEQYNFASLDEETLIREIAEKMEEVKARYEAVKPEQIVPCKVILNALELEDLFFHIARDLNYGTVYSHANLFHKGDKIQKNCQGDRIGITMAGQVPGNIRSSGFDNDGMSLGSVRLVEDGTAVNYYGSNRYGQYLGETPTGNLRCLCVDTGSVQAEEVYQGPYLEILSMSGLQVDFYHDYIGGEIRLAWYCDGKTKIPVTGISISGKLEDVLNTLRLSEEKTVHNGYTGPAKAILSNMNIF